MAKVALEGVTRRFETATAIEDITFEVPDGQFWVLVGPSGCGKSTILRAIAGLESITSGQIYLGETLVNEVPARRRDVAMVFQNYALYPHMTVAENLAFGLQMRQFKRQEISQRVQAVAQSLNIEHLLPRKPKQLSGGQQQRVALGRAIVREPKAFLLDEPLSNLDAQLREETRAELKKLHARLRTTTIYVTHDQMEAMTLAEKIVVLDRSRIQQIGSPQDIYRHPVNQMVATFLGSPPMNILPIIYQQDNFLICHKLLPITPEIKKQLKLTDGKRFLLGIRPENITLTLNTITDTEVANSLRLEVEVDIIEPLGREILVRGKLPEAETVVNFYAPTFWEGKRGDRAVIELDPEHLFIFASNTGETLYPLQQ
jgi:multiple sugar transport system ATP-binding protein